MKMDHQKQFKCDICDKKFRLKHHLKGDVRTVHEGVKNNECDICGKEFGHLGTLKRHIKVVHEKRRDFLCDTCDKSFTLLHHLKKHKIMVHESINMYWKSSYISNGNHFCKSTSAMQLKKLDFPNF